VLGCLQASFLPILTITLCAKFHSPHFSERETEAQREVKKTNLPHVLQLTRHRAGDLNLSRLLPKADMRSGDGLVHIITVLTGSPSQRKEGERNPNGFPRPMWVGPVEHNEGGGKARTLGSDPVGVQQGHLHFLPWVVTFANPSYPTWKMG